MANDNVAFTDAVEADGGLLSVSSAEGQPPCLALPEAPWRRCNGYFWSSASCKGFLCHSLKDTCDSFVPTTSRFIAENWSSAIISHDEKLGSQTRCQNQRQIALLDLMVRACQLFMEFGSPALWALMPAAAAAVLTNHGLPCWTSAANHEAGAAAWFAG